MPERTAAVLPGPVEDGGLKERGGDRPGRDVAFEGAAERAQLAEGLRQGADQEGVVRRRGGDRGLRQDEASAAKDALLVVGVDAVDRCWTRASTAVMGVSPGR